MDFDVLDISSISSEQLENMYSDNKTRFINLKSKNLEIVGEYEDNFWKINNDELYSKANFHFELPNFLYKKKNFNSLIESLKSWCILHLEENYSLEFISRKINCVIEATEKSNGFDIEFIDAFYETYFNEEYAKNTQNTKAAILIDFIEYANFNVADEYSEVIYKTYNSSLSGKPLVRKIPPSKDILKFSLIIEDYFKSKLSLEEYLRYFPIYLWWNLTNIIPLRIKEFCLIKANALTPTRDGYLLELPRLKERYSVIVHYDNILIPDSLAYSIQEYQEKTKKFGESKTLLNYLATRYHSSKKELFSKKKRNIDSFIYGDFFAILDSFYDKVVANHYGFEILEDSKENVIRDHNKYISRKIRPNDTRHFAFLNLMLQGYHPSEIARLGGHNSIYSQYSYHSHLEYWIDSDLVNLLMSQQDSLNNISNHFFQQILFKQKIFNPFLEKDIVKIPLKIGFCTDPNQNCMVDEHYLCEHWRITQEDYENHFDELQHLIVNQESILKKLVKQLLSLQEVAITNNKDIMYSNENSKFNYRLVENANEVKHALYQLFQLKEKVKVYEK